MRNRLIKIFVWIIPLLLFGYQNAISQSAQKVFLIGDAGEMTEEMASVISDVAKQVSEDPENSTVIFLGDNIYPKGMPELESKDRIEAEDILSSQIKPFLNLGCRVLMIPGNHDWKQGRNRGYEQVLRQQDFLDSLASGTELFFPRGGCPGPVVLNISSDLVIILIDTQWFLHLHEKPREESDCPVKTGLDVYAQLDGLLKANKNKKVLIAGHHPIYSQGLHGGRSNLKMHLFPMTDLNPSLYIPLPIVGSLYPGYRKYFGSIQDLNHPAYKVVRKSLADLFSKYPNTIYASGHDHSLQYIKEDQTHYIISGSGSKTTYVRQGKGSEFALSKTGYARLSFLPDGSVQNQFVTSELKGEHKVEFDEVIFKKAPYDPVIEKRDFEIPEKATRSASDQYLTKNFNKWLLGENYRDVWSAKIEFDFFDILEEHGGMEIVQRGGGMQTKSLRLQAETGRQYVLRSINKDPAAAIPPMLLGSFAQDVVQDQISAAHPYGAFVVPTLAEAVGIYHTNPKPVIIPNDPEFGMHREDFANVLALYEERPAKNWKGTGMFGDSKDIISTSKVLKKIHDDNDNYVDQQFVLRNRLFDLWIGDWDRHDDQWRWASFKNKKGKMFRPIPRDRDQAFFVNEGVLPKIASRKWALPKFQGFDHELKNVPGFMFNARWFDRSFLNGLEKDQWIQTATEIQKSVDDKVIDEALSNWPKAVRDLCGEEIHSKLAARRADLKKYALDHYAFLAKEVDIVGTDKKELFKVQREAGGLTKVDVYKISKSGEIKQPIYSRRFYPKETREIRLFGLDGDDRFEIEGEAKRGIDLRIIGGAGEDDIQDRSRVTGLSKHTTIYDTREGNNISKGKETRDRTSGRPGVNNYNRNAFQYNVTMPLAFAAFNIDDGIFVGGGALITTHGFRKDPYKSRHLIRGLFAFRTAAFDFKYKGIFNHVYRSLDLVADVNLEGPNYTRNFFGLGNESTYDRSNHISYYYVRFDNFIGTAQIRKRIGNAFSISLGPSYESIEVRQEQDRFITDISNASGNDTIFAQKQFAGLKLGFDLDTRDSEIFPRRGIHFWAQSKSMQPVDDQAFYYSRLEGAFSFYLSFRAPRTITFSNRIGGGWTDGDIEFYQAATIGGTGKDANVRGYRRTRFYGESAVYNNTELRITLFGFKTYLFPADFGIVGFYDIGRVWVDGENSDVWHNGYGFGIWMTPFESITLDLDIAYGEFWIGAFRFGFLF